jgi:hypothetical protein
LCGPNRQQLAYVYFEDEQLSRDEARPIATNVEQSGSLKLYPSGEAMRSWRGRAEQDRSAADEWDRIAAGVLDFLRDDPDARVVDRHAAARDEPRRKLNSTDLFVACLIVVVAFGLLHFLTPWGDMDVISGLAHAIERGEWSAAALRFAVFVVCAGLVVPLPYVLLRYIRGRA